MKHWTCTICKAIFVPNGTQKRTCQLCKPTPTHCSCGATLPPGSRSDRKFCSFCFKENGRRRAKARYWKNPEAKYMYDQNRRERLPELYNAAIRRFKKKYPERVNIDAQLRRKRIQKAIAPWGNRFFIREAYALAVLRTKLTGISWEVDHVIPLTHPNVCGLHVEANLQVIPGIANRIKHNLFQTQWS